MSRETRLARVDELQGTRAGFVSRILAAALDLGVILLVQMAIVAFVALATWVLTGSAEFNIDPPLPLVAAVLSIALTVVYFGYFWSTTGRTVGEQILGLRTLTEHVSRVPALRAYVRACLTVAFPIGLLWVLFSRKNASIQDLLCSTAVIYDWAYHPPAS